MWLHLGSLNGTHSTLSSEPFSSVIRKTPIGSTGITQPGKVGSATRMTASTGIAVGAERLHQESVVGRVDHARPERAVEHDVTDLGVVLVLVAAPLGNLDVRKQLVRASPNVSATG